MQSPVALERNRCPRCGCNAIQLIEGHPVCISCGLVIDEANRIKDRSQGKNGSKRKSESLRDLPFSRAQNTAPSWVDVKTLMGFLGISDSTEEKIALAMASIIDIAVKLNLSSDVIESAFDIYEDIAKKSTFKGKSIRALSAAIVYAASKKAGRACGLHEISRAAGIKTNKIFKCYKFVLEKIGYGLHRPSIAEYVARICGRLALNPRVADIATKIAVIAKESVQTSGAIASLAAASIYISAMVCGDARTQREIGDATGTTEATIRYKYKEIIGKIKVISNI